MGLFNSEPPYFGLDIGSTQIRLVQLRGSGAHPALAAYGSADVPINVSRSDASADRDKIAGIVRQLVKDSGATAKSVVLSLPADKVFAAVITTPKLNQAELAKSIRYQADQYVPMAIDQVKLDYVVIGPGTNENEQEVLLVAVPNSVANKYLEISEKAGLEVLALETNATAAARSLVLSPTSTVMLLDIGSSTTDLSIVSGGAPRLMRSVPVGGDTFVKSVAQNLGLDEPQALQFVEKFGLMQSKLEGQVYKAMKTSLDSLLGEIEKSTKFFATRYPNVPIEKVILCGRTVGVPELPVTLANATGLPVEIGNAWVSVSYPAKWQEQLMNVAGQFAVATGLAMRSYV